MLAIFQAALASWSLPVPLTVTVLLSAFIYLRGWGHLRSAAAQEIPTWRGLSYLCGLSLVWLAVGSPLAMLDEQFLTIHMIQHLLLMTIAPPLLLMGAPVMPFLHGLPRVFVRPIVIPVFRWRPAQRSGHFFSQPATCWLAATAALVGWHIPAAFNLALHSESWHVVEHACFASAGFLFWWPVVQPWPSVPVWPRWSMLLYLFLATLPCDILSAFLTFSDKVAYPVYLSAPHAFGISALADQQCAGGLMWTVVTVVYLVPAAILTIGLLGPRESQAEGGQLSKSV